jgi:dinuclear metal center YbgI/SA1388 family protein
MKAGDIAAIIEELAPGHLQESWDNSGFTIGAPHKEVNSALLALDCTPEVLQEAVEKGIGMIITHHPLIFSPLKRIVGASVVERMVETAIKNDIVIYSAHTNADKILPGVSGLMASRLGLVNVEILDKEDGGETGLGVVGDFESAFSFPEVLELVKSRFSLSLVRCSKPADGKISRVALCGGSGSSLIPAAIKSGAQLLITGDISYHRFLCEKSFMVMDIGHFESETEVLDFLKDVLLKKLVNFEVRISDNNNNLIYYY